MYKEVTLTMNYDQSQRSVAKITYCKFINAACTKRSICGAEQALGVSYTDQLAPLVLQPNEGSLGKTKVVVNKKWNIVEQFF